MNKLTYKEAYDKIITAYFRDEIKLMDHSFCFCGTLNGGEGWNRGGDQVRHYSSANYERMERALFSSFPDLQYWSIGSLQCFSAVPRDSKEYEDRLFSGMCAALEVLKDIHR